MVGNFRSIDPCVCHFPIPLGPFYTQLDLIESLFLQKKIGLSLSHLVPEIIWPTVGLFFHKNLSFHILEAICTNFLFEIWSCWPPFSLILDLFDPSFLQNPRSRWVHFLIACWTPSTENFVRICVMLSGLCIMMMLSVNISLTLPTQVTCSLTKVGYS